MNKPITGPVQNTVATRAAQADLRPDGNGAKQLQQLVHAAEGLLSPSE